MKNYRKCISILLCMIMFLLLVACSKDKTANIPSVRTDEDISVDKDSKVLVVYFSMPDNVDDSSVEIDGKIFGNTQYMAYVIQEYTEANIFRIIPEIPYTTDHDELVELAQEEKQNNARPGIKNSIENFDNYDTVFIGYPNWWGDMPMILYTFFDTYDFSGKNIITFNTHGGSGFSNTNQTIAELEPNAAVTKGLSISRDSIEDAKQDIINWLKGLGFEI